MEKNILFCLAETDDMDALCCYLDKLGNETRKRFGPHAFNKETLFQLINDMNYNLFIAKSLEDDTIVGYAILKTGWLDFEYPRLQRYGMNPEPGDCTIAPSIADSWQGKGIGFTFLSFLIEYVRKNLNFRRIFLWGGVQNDNMKAVRLYQKTGFRELGRFEHNGLNLDMILEL